MRSLGFLSHTPAAADTGLERGRWAGSLEELARECAGGATTVSMLPGREACALPLRAIDYHARQDVVEVAVGGGPELPPALCYFISAPRRVALRDEEARGVTLEVEDVDGVKTLVRIARALSGGGALWRVAPRAAGSGRTS